MLQVSEVPPWSRRVSVSPPQALFFPPPLSPQHRGSDATRVCAADHQHGLPELSADGAGTVPAHDR